MKSSSFIEQRQFPGQAMKLRSIDFGHVMDASGVRGWFGDGYPFHRLVVPFGLKFTGSTFVAKTTTLEPHQGNITTRSDGPNTAHPTALRQDRLAARSGPQCFRSPRTGIQSASRKRTLAATKGAVLPLFRGDWALPRRYSPRGQSIRSDAAAGTPEFCRTDWTSS